ncbi:MAG: 23S rRNA (adenine(2503)-C(2))-methyltransferase RlmN [Myxococcota bacterium]
MGCRRRSLPRIGCGNIWNDLRITPSHLRDLRSKGVTFTAANLLAAPAAPTSALTHNSNSHTGSDHNPAHVTSAGASYAARVQGLPVLDSIGAARRSNRLSAGAWELSALELERRGLSQQTFGRLHRPWTWSEAGPLLSSRDRRELESVGIELPSLSERHVSHDGSIKAVLQFGEDAVEAVHMPRAVRQPRVTLCVSSQVGCAMGCTFCATASMGLMRQLSCGEIVTQMLCMLRAFGPRHPGQLSLVFMGMGEPLHNLSAVAHAVELLAEPRGLGLSPRRITVSTSGLVPQIRALAELSVRPLLAVSLNATTDSTRSELMPIGRRYSLAMLHDALASYPLRARERITIEYVLLAGVNDSDDDAARLADFCRGFEHHINLIPFNAHAHSEFQAPSEERIDAFARRVLARRPCVLSVRRSRGSDVRAACGQLVKFGSGLARAANNPASENNSSVSA